MTSRGSTVVIRRPSGRGRLATLACGFDVHPQGSQHRETDRRTLALIAVSGRVSRGGPPSPCPGGNQNQGGMDAAYGGKPARCVLVNPCQRGGTENQGSRAADVSRANIQPSSICTFPASAPLVSRERVGFTAGGSQTVDAVEDSGAGRTELGRKDRLLFT